MLLILLIAVLIFSAVAYFEYDKFVAIYGVLTPLPLIFLISVFNSSILSNVKAWTVRQTITVPLINKNVIKHGETFYVTTNNFSQTVSYPLIKQNKNAPILISTMKTSKNLWIVPWSVTSYEYEIVGNFQITSIKQ